MPEQNNMGCVPNYLGCQFGTLKRGQCSKHLPFAFTENGVVMLPSFLMNFLRGVRYNFKPVWSPL